MSKKALVGLGGLGVGMFLAAFAANAIERPTYPEYAPPPPVYEGRSVAPAAPLTMVPYGQWEGGCFFDKQRKRSFALHTPLVSGMS
jgi:hypothetical protein